MRHTQEEFEEALRLLRLYWAHADLDFAWPMLDEEAQKLSEEAFNLLVKFGAIEKEKSNGFNHHHNRA